MRELSYERRVQLLALAAGFPGSLIAMILLWHGSYSSGTVWTLAFLIFTLWLGFAFSLRHRVVFSLQTLSNLLAALREEDFSLRARGARSDDAMGEVMIEVNALGEVLRQQRLGALEANALLRTVMEEIDLAVFTFDNNSKLRLVNRAGERLLGRPEERLLGFTAEELGLGACLEGEAAHTMELAFPGGSGRWGMRRGTFRQGGLPHHLVVLTDLSRTLRDEERKAWQRLIRVLGHELNNSLAPIQSVAQGLESGLLNASKSSELQGEASASILDDLRQGLGIIRSRTEALGRFMAAYAQLARLPQPKLLPVNVSEWINRSVKLETRVKVNISKGPEVVISADAGGRAGGDRASAPFSDSVARSNRRADHQPGIYSSSREQDVALDENVSREPGNLSSATSNPKWLNVAQLSPASVPSPASGSVARISGGACARRKAGSAGFRASIPRSSTRIAPVRFWIGSPKIIFRRIV